MPFENFSWERYLASVVSASRRFRVILPWVAAKKKTASGGKHFHFFRR
jgi:hypothetical protein